MKTILPVVVHRAAAAALLLVASACAREGTPAAAADTAVPVHVVEVAWADGALPVRATGMVAGRDEAELSFKVGGVISRVAVRPGDVVRAGQTLAEVQPAEIDAQVTKARSAAEQAGRELTRIRALHRDSVATLAQLEQVQTAAAVAEADLRAATFNRRHATIIAPSNGTVLARLREPNEIVAAGATVLVMRATAGGAVLHVGLADRDAVRTAVGAAVVVRFDAYPGRTFSGRVTQVAARANPATGTYEADVALDARDVSLASGLVGRAEITARSTRQVLTVPVEALLEADADSASVFIADAAQRRVTRRTVHVAFVRDGLAALADVSLAGAHVVTDGAAELRDGASIRVVPPAALAAQRSAERRP